MKPLIRVLLMALLCTCTSLQAQDIGNNLKTWYGHQFSFNFNKKYTVKYGQLYSFNTSRVGEPHYHLGFVQNAIAFEYRFHKKHSIEGGYSMTHYRNWRQEKNDDDDDDDDDHEEFELEDGEEFVEENEPNLDLSTSNFHRFHVTYAFRHKAGKSKVARKFKFKHSLRAEWHLPRPAKYRFRFIYSFRFYYYNKKWPMRLSPYIENRIYYYLDGKKISYYDDNGQLAAKKAPSDFHRYRLRVGFRFKPIKSVPDLTFDIYFASQFEFNTGLAPHRELNHTQPSGKTKAPFNNYSVIGIGVSYKFRWKKKKKPTPK